MENQSVWQRVMTIIISAGLGGAVIWRGNTYNGPDGEAGMSLIPVVMCSLFGLACVLAGLAMAAREDAESQPDMR